MDTKWKNILRSNALKFISFLLAVIFFTSGLSLFVQSLSNVRTFGLSDTWDNENFYESETLTRGVSDVYNALYTLVGVYQSEANIKSGALIDESQLHDYKLSLFQEDYEKGVWDGTRDDQTYEQWEEEMLSSDDFLNRHASEIDAWEKEKMNEQLDAYHSILNGLNEKKERYGLQWNASNGEIVHASDKNLTDETAQKAKVYYINHKGQINTSVSNVNSIPGMYIETESAFTGSAATTTHGNTDCDIVFYFDDAKMDTLAAVYQSERSSSQQALSQFIVLMALALVAMGICMAGIGRKPEDDTAYLVWEDHMGLDLHLFLICILSTLGYAGGISCIVYKMPFYNGFLLNMAATALAVNWILSLTRVIKAGKITECILLVRICRGCWKILVRFGQWASGYYHQYMDNNSFLWLFIGLFVLMIVSVLLTPFFIGVVILAVILYKGIKQAKILDQIVKGVATMHDGDMTHKIEVKGKGRMAKMAEAINTIQEGMTQAVEEAVDREIRSERMKTELITNVSHDIRTPLTSIINYIDLLKQPEITDADRSHYLDVLTAKADRLKALTDDLFEAAKASSGSIEVHYGSVNFMSLLDQGMGELEDKIAAVDLDFIISRPEKKLLVHADGRLLWRVIENLLGNVIKYALEGSRVYITLEPEGDYGVFTIKNISKAPLNIPAEELMERFKRGDDTRHSEGSGLGLSIARDLTTLQQGTFELSIDGDLFKAIVRIPLEKL